MSGPARGGVVAGGASGTGERHDGLDLLLDAAGGSGQAIAEPEPDLSALVELMRALGDLLDASGPGA